MVTALPTTDELRRSLRFMSDSEIALLTLLTNPTALWIPQPGPQTDAYLCQADELYFGGAAGGGKSDLLLGLAITAHQSTVIFRREYTQLVGAGGLIERSRQLLTNVARYNGMEHTWRNIPDERTLEFGAVQYESDAEKWQGQPHDLVAFDELPHFSESQYRYLVGWNRTTTPGQRCRVVATGNPPMTPEGEWVVKRWAAWLDPTHPNPAVPGELRYYAIVDGEEVERPDGSPFLHGDELIEPKSRTFIPALLSDNAYLAETDYKATLQAMPEPMRSKLLYGDFSIGFEDDPWQVIPTAWVIAAQGRWTKDKPDDVVLQGLGVDVARGGKDQTVLARRYGYWYAPLEKHPGSDTPNGQEVVQWVMLAIESGVLAFVDVIGVGASVYDILRMQNVATKAVNFAAKSTGHDKSGRLSFVNKRAELYWKMREALDPNGGQAIALPNDRELRADLCTARWKITPRGIQIESKEDIKKRLGRSPDCADAVVMALDARPGGSPFAVW